MCGDDNAFRRLMRKVELFMVTIALNLLQSEPVRNPISQCLSCLSVAMLRGSAAQGVEAHFRECDLIDDEQLDACATGLSGFVAALREGALQDRVMESNTIPFIVKCAAQFSGVKPVVTLLLATCCDSILYEVKTDESVGGLTLEQGQSLRQIIISWLRWRPYDSLDAIPMTDVDGRLSIVDRVEGVRNSSLDDVMDESCLNFDYEIKTQLYSELGFTEESVRTASTEFL